MDFLGQMRFICFIFFSQEITLQQIMSQIANVKKDMIILEKSEFSALRSENEVKLKSHSHIYQVLFLLGYGGYNACTQKCTKKCTPQMKKWSLTGTPRPAVTHSSHSSTTKITVATLHGH